MVKAAARLAQALVDGERVAVFGDYDVDGATSAALLARYFQALGRPLTVYVPDRIIEGYGPNSAALTKLFDDGHRLVVTVDCGIAAHEPLAAAKALGLDLIVVDHHLPTAALPPAFAIVNPNRADDHSAQGMLAAVGVTFMVLVAINRHLRQIDGFTRLGRAEPDLRALLDIVALGTVADVVPLTGANRALVTAGLKVLERNPKPGLSALLQVAGLEPDPARQLGVYHLGYVLGPRINAGGRVGRADLGARILASDEPVETAALAAELNHFNSERKAVEALVLDAAIDMVARTPDAPLALAVGRGWHPGVIGIVAGRLKERFRKPAFVIAMDQGVGKGSGRSVPGINLGAIVHQAVDRGLLLAGGGHAMAAGLTVEEARLDELCAFLNQAVTETSGAAPDAVLELDGVVSVAGANLALAQALQRAGPFGAGNVEPRLAIAQARVIKADIVGSNHVRCVFTGADGGRLAGIAFRAAETPLGQGLLRGIGKTMHLAGNLQIDTWQNQQRVQIQIEDAAQPS
jgi:single-stranded-DNA-specific exonuclease